MPHGALTLASPEILSERGGPLDSTRVLALEIYQTAFHSLRIGEAATMAFVLLIIVAMFTIIQLRLQRSDWEL